MLQQGKPTPQLRQWMDRLATVVEQAQETLRGQATSELAARSGCRQDTHGDLRLTFLNQEYIVSADDFTVRRADAGEKPSSFVNSLILTYLATADGTPTSGRWIGFRDLPDGMFYVQAFQGYTGGRLVRQLDGDVQAFRRAAKGTGGQRLDLGSAGYSFHVLPRVRLALVFWEGDDEFPSQAQVLFDQTAPHYMSTDGLAILGSQLVGGVLKAARG
jgi:hypothetical protein